MYSQSLLDTYKNCPKKFKFKYIDNIYLEKSNNKESLNKGQDFHLICERFFENIETDISDEKYKTYINRIQKHIDLKFENLFTEYEINYKLDENILVAKFDMILVKENSVEIWDWKTNSKKSKPQKYENSIQTFVYLYLAKEVLPKVFNKNLDFKDISINYFEVEFDDGLFKINHSEKNHKIYEKNIKNIIKKIENEEFENINLSHCKYCEYEKLCKEGFNG